MNERIQDLKKQAMVKVITYGARGERLNYWYLDEDKFAQLIIQECADFVGAQGSKAVIQLYEHFGVCE